MPQKLNDANTARHADHSCWTDDGAVLLGCPPPAGNYLVETRADGAVVRKSGEATISEPIQNIFEENLEHVPTVRECRTVHNKN